MLTIGHRGCAGLEAENTLRAFRRAIALGVDAIELDVRLSRDGVPVVIHDDTLQRTTEGSGRVGDFSFDELKKIPVKKGHGESLPSLEEVFALKDWNGGGMGFNVQRSTLNTQRPTSNVQRPEEEVLSVPFSALSSENLKLKTENFLFVVELKEKGTAAPVARLIEERRLEARSLIISFDHDLLRETRRLNPSLSLGALWSEPPADAVETAKKLGAALDVNYRHTTAALVRAAREAGLPFYIWTVNDAAAMRQMMALGVDGIATDFPDVLLALVSEKK